MLRASPPLLYIFGNSQALESPHTISTSYIQQTNGKQYPSIRQKHRNKHYCTIAEHRNILIYLCIW